MTSIGRLLVVMSIDFPQCVQMTDIGVVAGVWVGLSGGGGGALGPMR